MLECKGCLLGESKGGGGGCPLGLAYTLGSKIKETPKSNDHSDLEHDFGPHKICHNNVTSSLSYFGPHVFTLGPSFFKYENKVCEGVFWTRTLIQTPAMM
jgi:hypothetical protein